MKTLKREMMLNGIAYRLHQVAIQHGRSLVSIQVEDPRGNVTQFTMTHSGNKWESFTEPGDTTLLSLAARFTAEVNRGDVILEA